MHVISGVNRTPHRCVYHVRRSKKKAKCTRIHASEVFITLDGAYLVSARLLCSTPSMEVGNFSYFFHIQNCRQCINGKLTWNAKQEGNQFSLRILLLFVFDFLDASSAGLAFLAWWACDIFKTAMHTACRWATTCNWAWASRMQYAPNRNVVLNSVRTLCLFIFIEFIFSCFLRWSKRHGAAHTNSLFPCVNRKWPHTFRHRLKITAAVAHLQLHQPANRF